MYNELYDAWMRELQNPELEKLPSDFYSNAAKYLKKLKEEGRMLDKRTVKARLLRIEGQNVKRMLHELIKTRYKKLLRKTSEGYKIPDDTLAAEEVKLLSGFSPLIESYQAFAKGLLQGQLLQIDAKCEQKNAVLRFLKDVPAIVGSDMKSYGPFKVEDVASVPIENAKILVKQSLAEKVEG